MGKKITKILRDRRGSSFPLAIALTLALLIIFCGISEYFRLHLIAAGVRDAAEDGIISTVNDNYYGVYHGVREGYSGNYLPSGGGAWVEALNEGDIYSFLDRTLGTQEVCGRHVKYAGNAGMMEFAIDSLAVSVRNVPLAPSDPRNVQRFEVDAIIRLEVPVRFGGSLCPPMRITLKVQAGYIEVF